MSEEQQDVLRLTSLRSIIDLAFKCFLYFLCWLEPSELLTVFWKKKHSYLFDLYLSRRVMKNKVLFTTAA